MHGFTRHESLTTGGSPPSPPAQVSLRSFKLIIGLTLVVACEVVTAACPVRTGGTKPLLLAERIGPVVVDRSNHYSENIRVRLRLQDAAGRPYCGYPRPLRIEEWRTQVYDGRYGASMLPMNVDIGSGSAEFTLKSLARYTSIDLRKAPTPQIAIFLEGHHLLLDLPQWVDQDGNDRIDWLEAMVDDILARMRSSRERAVTDVVGALSGWKQSWLMDCGYFREQDPLHAYISPVCLDWGGVNQHRTNAKQELAATILHEARHVWVHRHHVKLDTALARYARLNRRSFCDPKSVRHEPCMAHIQDERYDLAEADAEAFADRYKQLFP